MIFNAKLLKKSSITSWKAIRDRKVIGYIHLDTAIDLLEFWVRDPPESREIGRLAASKLGLEGEWRFTGPWFGEGVKETKFWFLQKVGSHEEIRLIPIEATKLPDRELVRRRIKP